MDSAHIRPYAHRHCRFKLRSGKEIYGVVWEVETSEHSSGSAPVQRLFFASVRDYERLQRSGSPVQVIPMQAEEIVAVESLAS